MKVLVIAASKHGATVEIAASIADTLAEHGLDVDVLRTADVTTLEGYDGVVMGSAIYAGRWMKSARTLVHRLHDELTALPVWLFSSGPVGDPPKPDPDQLDVQDIVRSIGPRDHRLFGGSLDKGHLGFAERLMARLVDASDGDRRDWIEIADWTDGIAQQLTTQAMRDSA